jgi:acetyl-CoA carboxylase carboxyltransferase component
VERGAATRQEDRGEGRHYLGTARRHLIDEVIDPAATRDVIVRFLESARTRSAIGQHRLASWPTEF